MEFKRERDFLKNLCKGHVRDLITEVGWTETQCKIIEKRYLEFKMKPKICMEIGISTAQFTREFNDALLKLHSYMLYMKNGELKSFYQRF